jgi:hypothetical protein
MASSSSSSSSFLKLKIELINYYGNLQNEIDIAAEVLLEKDATTSVDEQEVNQQRRLFLDELKRVELATITYFNEHLRHDEDNSKNNDTNILHAFANSLSFNCGLCIYLKSEDTMGILVKLNWYLNLNSIQVLKRYQHTRSFSCLILANFSIIFKNIKSHVRKCGRQSVCSFKPGK